MNAPVSLASPPGRARHATSMATMECHRFIYQLNGRYMTTKRPAGARLSSCAGWPQCQGSRAGPQSVHAGAAGTVCCLLLPLLLTLSILLPLDSCLVSSCLLFRLGVRLKSTVDKVRSVLGDTAVVVFHPSCWLYHNSALIKAGMFASLARRWAWSWRPKAASSHS